MNALSALTSLLAYFAEAFSSLWRHRTRSFLTMLGMIIGSASIIAVFGISRATTSGITATFTSFGQQPVQVSVDDSQDDPARAQIHYRDIARLSLDLGASVRALVPQWDATYSATANGRTEDLQIQQDGAYHTDGLLMAEGEKFTAGQIEGAQRVAVVTNDVAHFFFGDEPAVGNQLRVNGEWFTIVGVYAKVQGSLINGLAASSILLMPYTTFENAFAGEAPPQSILLYPANALDGDAVGKAAIASLQRIHGPRAKYRMQNGAEEMHTFYTVLNSVSIGLSAIGGVALLVAGIGIMNIMLVSVTERTREIGIRKSIGASRRDIMLQFLIEAVMLSLGGGLIGMLIGIGMTVGAASALSSQLGTMLIPYLSIVGVALIFSLTVGTVFGTYPALRAAKMDPIQALRS